MKTEYQKAKTYLFNIFSKAKPEVKEKTFWEYIQYTIIMRANYEQINPKLLEGIVIKHNKDMGKY